MADGSCGSFFPESCSITQLLPLFFVNWYSEYDLMIKKDVTIYDLASKLKVSTATISRALNDDPAVSKKTRKAVLDAAQQLGYQRNHFARVLRHPKTYTIGVLVPELGSHFITAVIAGIEKVAARADYQLLIAHSAENYEKEVTNINNLFHKRVDGLIASLAANTRQFDHFRLFTEKSIPLVFFDRAPDTSEYSRVIINNEKGGYTATRHLIDQGCRNIVLVTGNTCSPVYAERQAGFVRALTQAGIPCRPENMISKDLNNNWGTAIAQEIMNRPDKVDGLFITQDHTAAVCMQALKAHGWRIPEDIAVVGFNDDLIATIATPQLTTIRYPADEIGQMTARLLLDQLEGKLSQPCAQTTIIQSELIIRGSSRRLSR